MKGRKTVSWTLAALWMVLIFYLSHQPASVSGGMSSVITDYILSFLKTIFSGLSTELLDLNFIVRKLAHFVAYFVLGVLFMNTLTYYGRARIQTMISAFLLTILYAASDEFHQLFIVGRSGEVRDVLIDGSGGASGILFYSAVLLLINSRKKVNG